MPIRFYNSGFQSGLEALSQGAMQGHKIGLGLAENEKDRELRRAALDISAANQKLNEDEAARARVLQTVGLARERETDEAARGIADLTVGGGMQGPLADPEEERARQIIPLLNAKTVPLFIQNYKQRQIVGMLKDQRERHLSQWTDLANDPELAALSPRQQEEAQARAQEATEILGAFSDPNKPGEIVDPEGLEEALKASAKGLTDQRTLIGKRLQQAEEKQRIIGFYQPELAEMQAALRGLPPDIAAQMQDRINILSTGLAGYQIGAITPAQLQAFWHNAKNGMRPDGSGGGGKEKLPPWLKARDLLEADVKNGLIEGVTANGALVKWEEATADDRERGRRRRQGEYQTMLERDAGGGAVPGVGPQATPEVQGPVQSLEGAGVDFGGLSPEKQAAFLSRLSQITADPSGDAATLELMKEYGVRMPGMQAGVAAKGARDEKAAKDADVRAGQEKFKRERAAPQYIKGPATGLLERNNAGRQNADGEKLVSLAKDLRSSGRSRSIGGGTDPDRLYDSRAKASGALEQAIEEYEKAWGKVPAKVMAEIEKLHREFAGHAVK